MSANVAKTTQAGASVGFEVDTMKKESRKVKYTKKVIKEAFLDLLKEKDISQITVKELCEMADINRATFYSHFENIYFLSREIEAEMAHHALASIDLLYQESDYAQNMISTLFHLFIDQKEMSLWFMDDKSSGLGMQIICNYAKEKCIPVWMEQKKVTRDEAERFFAFIYHGALAFLKDCYTKNLFDKPGIEEEFYALITKTLEYIY